MNHAVEMRRVVMHTVCTYSYKMVGGFFNINRDVLVSFPVWRSF